MTLSADGRAAFKLDCNKGSGGWKAGRGEFTFTPIAMTRAMCPEGSLDTRIAKELEDVRSYSIEGSRLTLVLAAGGTQVWTRAD
jgi:heat shock protein HslJ